MKQLQFAYTNKYRLSEDLGSVKLWMGQTGATKVLFHIYTTNMDSKDVKEITEVIDRELPDALYVGSSANGNIYNGVLSTNDTVISCTLFEDPSTEVRVIQYMLSDDTSRAVADSVLKYIDDELWVKGVELLTIMRNMSMTRFCNGFHFARPEVDIFGGGAFGPNINDQYAYVFSKGNEISSNAVVFVFYGGENVHIKTTYITGWKPLGKAFKVTKSESFVLYELDGRPAYDTYYKYLNIKNDDNFFKNTLEFPFIFDYNGIQILRAPISSRSDGSLEMTADIEEGTMARLTYGDPWTILESVRVTGQEIADFKPQAIQIFSCAARKEFWGDKEAERETMPFQEVASTFGFYTAGEFLRTNGYMNQHNVTLVIAAMREGEPDDSERILVRVENEKFSGQVSMVSRLANFIRAYTDELNKTNALLEKVAITDELTQLYNRREIHRRINRKVRDCKAMPFLKKPALIMMDLDNFKKVNDTFGHHEGDVVLQGFCEVVRDIVSKYSKDGDCGRWGGEEFMILLYDDDSLLANDIAEKIRKRFEEVKFPRSGYHTVSLGVARLKDNESSDSLVTRVDALLYEAKGQGKNRVISD